MTRELVKKESTFFWLILLAASVMRCWNFWGWSYTHDELSAFNRLTFSSFGELIREGVQNNDMHPAFTQVFLYGWTSLFGLSEFAVRLPFVAAGIGSVALIYRIAHKWFGFTAACFSSLALALLDFPILYSQIARPYSPGLFFSMLAVWCWTDLLMGDNKRMYRKAFYYGAATALCMLTHYFSFFFSMIVAVTGFLFLTKENWKPYLASGIVALLIFSPHIPVSLHQFGMGGVGDWLGKPESDFLWKYILYGFNDSPMVVIGVTGISMLSVVMYHLDIRFSRLHLVCLGWFIIPFAAGYYYSVTVNPVLQYSTLLFSFPFLPVFLFSFFKETKTLFNRLLLAGTGLVVFCSTVIGQKFYKKEQFGVFQEIAEATVELNKKYGEKNITTVLNTSSQPLFDFYFNRMNEFPPYTFCLGNDPGFIRAMVQKVDSSSAPYFLYGWSNFLSPYEIPEIIKRKYPCIVYDDKHFNSYVTLFGKSDSCRRDTVFFLREGFETKNHRVSFDSTAVDTAPMHTGKYGMKIDLKNEFCFTLKAPVKNIFRNNEGCVNISFFVLAKDTFNAQMVMDIGQPTGKHDWHARLLYSFVTKRGTWQEVFATFKLPDTAFPDDEATIYLWNPGKNSFYLDDIVIASFADSRYEYYEVSYRK